MRHFPSSVAGQAFRSHARVGGLGTVIDAPRKYVVNHCHRSQLDIHHPIVLGVHRQSHLKISTFDSCEEPTFGKLAWLMKTAFIVAECSYAAPQG